MEQAGIVNNLKKELAEKEVMIDGLEAVLEDLQARKNEKEIYKSL